MVFSGKQIRTNLYLALFCRYAEFYNAIKIVKQGSKAAKNSALRQFPCNKQ